MGFRTILTVLLLGLGACALAFAQTRPGGSIAASIGISAPAAPFTELYFDQPAQLGGPASAGHARARQTVSFAIRSHEPTSRIYAWTITTGTGRQLAAGTAAVRAGRTALITRRVGVCPPRGAPPHRRAVQVLVALAKPAESIGYWARCHG